jgi:hypothetical protein
VHVVGCRRSGTTLMHEVMKACLEHAFSDPHESSIFDSALIEGISLTKKPTDIPHLKPILEKDPNLFVIYVLRDPRDIVTSMHPNRPDTYFCSFERWSRYQKAAQPLINHERFLVVRYEDLVQDPDGVQAQLMKQLPFLKEKHTFSNFHEHTTVNREANRSLLGLRAVDQNSVEKWRQHLPRIAFQLSRYPSFASELVEYGFEPDEAWLEVVKDEPVLAQTYGERPKRLLTRMETALRYWIKQRRYIYRFC